MVALLALALSLSAVPAGAAEAGNSQSVAALRAQADAIAARYLDALTHYKALDHEIADNQHVVATLAAQARRARMNARARALSAYRAGPSQLSSIVASQGVLVASRRVAFIDQVNQRDHAAYARLRAATRDLNAQRRLIETERQQQADALAALRSEGAAMDAKLAQAQQREQEAARARIATLAAATTTTAAAKPTTPPTTIPAAPTPPPSYVGTPGTYAMHDDPFLTCVRLRESGGNYSAVNPAGPYLGAYQFSQTTWNGAANHGGLGNLVGVPPNVATPYDQDNVAWILYQWQGAGPWGGSCP